MYKNKGFIFKYMHISYVVLYDKFMKCAYFFNPYIQPAKSLVIFPLSIVSTQAFSNFCENLQNKSGMIIQHLWKHTHHE